MIDSYLNTLQDNWPALLKALYETGFMVFFALLAAVFIGLPLGTLIFFTRRGGVHQNRLWWIIADGFVTVVRSIPFLLFVVFLIPLSRLVMGTSLGLAGGTFPMLFVAVAIYARLTEQILLEVNPQISRTAKAMGASSFQIASKFLIPEAKPGLVYALTSATITLISYSTILGVVGAGGLGDFAMRYGYQHYNFPLMYTAVFVTVLCVLVIQFGGHKLSAHLDKR